MKSVVQPQRVLYLVTRTQSNKKFLFYYLTTSALICAITYLGQRQNIHPDLFIATLRQTTCEVQCEMHFRYLCSTSWTHEHD